MTMKRFTLTCNTKVVLVIRSKGLYRSAVEGEKCQSTMWAGRVPSHPITMKSLSTYLQRCKES